MKIVEFESPMARTVHYSLVILVLAGLALLWPQVAIACSCLPYDSLSQEFAESDAVLLGTVTHVIRNPFNHEDTAFFQVEKSWKGVAMTKVKVHTGLMGSGGCGFNFSSGEKYLVFAHGTERWLGTGICTRTKGFSSASGELGYLETLSELELTEPPASPVLWSGSVIGLGIVLIVTIRFLRRRPSGGRAEEL